MDFDVLLFLYYYRYVNVVVQALVDVQGCRKANSSIQSDGLDAYLLYIILWNHRYVQVLVSTVLGGEGWIIKLHLGFYLLGLI